MRTVVQVQGPDLGPRQGAWVGWRPVPDGVSPAALPRCAPRCLAPTAAAAQPKSRRGAEPTGRLKSAATAVCYVLRRTCGHMSESHLPRRAARPQNTIVDKNARIGADCCIINKWVHGLLLGGALC